MTEEGGLGKERKVEVFLVRRKSVVFPLRDETVGWYVSDKPSPILEVMILDTMTLKRDFVPAKIH